MMAAPNMRARTVDLCLATGSAGVVTTSESIVLAGVGAATPTTLLSATGCSTGSPRPIFVQGRALLHNTGASAATVECVLGTGPTSRDSAILTLSAQATMPITLFVANSSNVASADLRTSIWCQVAAGSAAVSAESVRLLAKFPTSVSEVGMD
jgi:hypothetical protein